MRAKTIFLGLIAIFIFSSSVPAQRVWTLEQCIDTALTNNRNMKLQRINYDSRNIAYQQSKNAQLPNLNGSVGQNFNFGRSLAVDNTYQNSNSQTTSFSISGGLNLFNGFRVKNTIDARRADLLASGADLQKIEKDIVMNVSTVFLQVLQNKELLVNAENQLAITQENIDRRRVLINSGKLAEGEIYELQAQLAKEEVALVQAQNNLELSLLDLALVMDLEEIGGLDVVVPNNLLENELALLNAEEVYGSAVLSRSEIQSAEYRLQSNEKNVEIAKSGYLPSLSLGASWGTGFYNMSNMPQNLPFADQFKNNISTGVGLNLSIPIFNRFETKSQVTSAKLNVESSRLEIENVKKELRKNIQQAYYNALAAKNRWEASEKSVKANEESYRFANQKFEVGRGNQYEVNLAKNNLTQSISEQTQSKYEYVFRLKILELMK